MLLSISTTFVVLMTLTLVRICIGRRRIARSMAFVVVFSRTGQWRGWRRISIALQHKSLPGYIISITGGVSYDCRFF